MLTIAVCGATPVAHSIAAVCALRGHRVRVWVDAAPWSDRFAVELPDSTRWIAPLYLTSTRLKGVVVGADIVFVCVHHDQIPRLLQRLSPLLDSRTLIGGVPGFGGFGLWARLLLPTHLNVFGFQRIPFVVRACARGQSVTIGAERRQSFIGTLPAGQSRAVAELLAEVLGIRGVPVSHYINIELSPSNSLVNPARLYARFVLRPPRHWTPLEEFFLDWNLSASRVLLALDRELQDARRLIGRDTSFVAPLLFQYDANDAHTLTDRIRNLRSLAGRKLPLHQTAAGEWQMNAASPYITEDVDIGLRLLRDTLRLAGARTPWMDQILAWRDGLQCAEAADRPSRQQRNPLDNLTDITQLLQLLD